MRRCRRGRVILPNANEGNRVCRRVAQRRTQQRRREAIGGAIGLDYHRGVRVVRENWEVRGNSPRSGRHVELRRLPVWRRRPLDGTHDGDALLAARFGLLRRRADQRGATCN